MNKKNYVVPAIKSQAMESDTLLAASGEMGQVNDGRPGSDEGDGSQESENQFAKKNTFSSVWGEDEY